MEQFSISFRLGKPSAPHGANLAHNNREFSAANIDPARSDHNIFFTAMSIADAYEHLFGEALEAYNAKQTRPVRRIDDYYAHIAGGKREEPFYEVIVQFGDSKNAPCGSTRGEMAREMLIEYMREDIDHFALFSNSLEELLERMRKANYEIKRGKYLAACPQYGTNFIRFRSLGERYTEEALKRRIVYLSQYERFFQTELPKVRERRAPNQVVLETMAFYMRTVREGKIRLRRMDKTRPFIWKNDPEMNALLRLNKMINDGATLASIRKEFADKEQAVLHLREKLEKSRSDLKSFIVLQEKCEIVFGLRYSEKYTHEQAAETLKGYPSINAGNWKRVYDLVADEKKAAEDLQSKLAQAEAELKDAAEIAGIAERVFGTTFVQDAIHRRNCEQVGDCLPNGSFTPDGFYRR